MNSEQERYLKMIQNQNVLVTRALFEKIHLFRLVPCSKFQSCKKSSNIEVKENQIVIAKMATYSPWPAKIVEIIDSKAKVFFFGTNQHGFVKKSECVASEDCGPLIYDLSTRNKRITTKQ